ncbi:MAG TPA: Holliday junction branch migration protein RuvA [Candidatus Eisenbacteria bacterium]|nr:Holliday junction branch migration protein RuvA [Candidatus Eisenbacteria bacterium]
MIAHISGILAHKLPGEVVVDVGGVGYQVFIPLNVFYRLPEIGQRTSFHIHTHLREDALQLYGFHELAEKRIFLLLINVAGIGPRLAINILSGIPADELTQAIKDGDQARLVSIPGVGKKLAERMLVELRDKFAALEAPAAAAPGVNGARLSEDAVSALVNLGYRKADVEKALRDVIRSGDESLQEIIRGALRRLSR